MTTNVPQIDLLAALTQGIPVVTVNRRLRRGLEMAYDSHCRLQGLTVWARPPLYTKDAWLRDLCRQLDQSPVILSSAQCHLIWEQIVRADMARIGHVLLQVPPTARAARSAANLLQRYQVSFSNAEAATDQRAFLRWYQVWQRRVATENWCDPECLALPVIAALAVGDLSAPEQLIFAGFDDLAPDDLQLRTVLSERGCRCLDWQPPAQPEVQCRSVGCADLDDEVRYAAQQVRQILEQRPMAKIGVVVTQMAQYQSRLQSLFFAELDPSVYAAGVSQSFLVNISLGHTLDGRPPICAALRLLRLGRQVPLEEIAWLLRTPYLAGFTSERAARAQADRDLRQRRLAQWPLAGLCRLFGAQVPLRRFTTVLTARKEQLSADRRQTPGAWGEQLARELHSCGWPGDRPLSSEDYQAVERFRDQLAALASLDLVAPEVDRAGAVALLTSLCAETTFQAEGTQASVQVLGLLETAGQSFDYLLVLGLHDAAFPAAASPNPFIPLPLQRSTRMPHADAVRELDFARRIASHLFAAAAEVVLCWPRRVDGAARRRSPLLAPYAELAIETVLATDPAARLQRQAPVLASCIDSQAPPIHSLRPVSGGTGLIKDQALCPFRAFAHHRLRAEAFDAVDIGLDAAARGTLVHAVLEFFWNETGSHAGLMSLSAAARRTRLQSCAEQALVRFEKQRRCDLSVLQRRLEAQRLVRLAEVWLELEVLRKPFTVAAEKLQTEAVGPLQIRTRIDRIDTLDDGRQVIIDYKTGQADAKQWLDERLTEPQLPVYCQNLPAETVAAVLFAVVRNSTCRFSGFAATADDWPGLNSGRQQRALDAAGITDFPALLRRWRPVLAALGESFVAGSAAVAPVQAKTCTFCDLLPLCRIHEQTAALFAAGEEGE